MAVDEVGQRILEHRGIELERLAVGIEIGAGEARFEHGRAERRRRAENLVDIAVFRAAQAERIEARGGQQIGRVGGAAMRRGQHQRRALPVGGDDLERRIARRDGCATPFHGLNLGAEAGILSPCARAAAFLCMVWRAARQTDVPIDDGWAS